MGIRKVICRTWCGGKMDLLYRGNLAQALGIGVKSSISIGRGKRFYWSIGIMAMCVLRDAHSSSTKKNRCLGQKEKSAVFKIQLWFCPTFLLVV